MKLYVFNPDADMALACNTESYIAPAAIRRFAGDLALLPVWYAQPGSLVLVPKDYDVEYLKLMRRLFPIQVDVATLPEVSKSYANVQVVPWGWSPALRKRMSNAGIWPLRLPSAEEIGTYRGMAGRNYSAGFGRKVDAAALGGTVAGRRMVLDGGDLDLFEFQMNKMECFQPIVLKSLWSGSGKGLRWCLNSLTKSSIDWCRNEVERYGAFVVEPVFQKAEDFAMEFFSNGRGEVLFTGYSLFHTNAKGAYQSSALSTDALIEKRLCRYIPLYVLVRVRELVQQLLERYYGHDYVGPIGVDMMIVKSNADGIFPYSIHPHVEVNLRMTMGMVARQFYDRYVVPGREGRFYVETYSSPAALQEKRAQDICRYPLAMKDGRIASGCLELVPVTSKSCSRAYVLLH